MAALGRLCACLLVGLAAGVVGGYVGLRVAGSSVQSTSAGTAAVSVSADATPGLVVSTSDPPAQLRYAAWSVPVAVNVSVRSVDPAVLLAAALDQNGQRAALVSDAKEALRSAVERIALAALLGALACGLLAGIALAFATGRRLVVLAVAAIACLACAGVLASVAAQLTSSINARLSTPSCQLAGVVGTSGAAQALARGNPSTATATAIALRVACDPAFASDLQNIAGLLHGA